MYKAGSLKRHQQECTPNPKKYAGYAIVWTKISALISTTVIIFFQFV